MKVLVTFEEDKPTTPASKHFLEDQHGDLFVPVFRVSKLTKWAVDPIKLGNGYLTDSIKFLNPIYPAEAEPLFIYLKHMISKNLYDPYYYKVTDPERLSALLDHYPSEKAITKKEKTIDAFLDNLMKHAEAKLKNEVKIADAPADK